MRIITLSIGPEAVTDGIRLVSKAVKWHSRPGKVKSYKSSGSSGGNSNSKKRHYTSLLVAHAMSYGYLNGVSIRKRR